MFGRGWKVGSIAGIPIKLDGSWVWIAVLYTYTLYLIIKRSGVTVTEPQAISLSIVAALLFFGSVLVHEFAHAGVARALGIDVAGVTLVFWGGYTETHAERRGPLGEFLVSAAGPLSSLALAGVFLLLSRGTVDANAAVSHTLGYLGRVNLLLAALNSLPGFPLDGGRVLLAIAWRVTGDRRRATRIAASVGFVVGIALGSAAVMAVLRGRIDLAIWGGLIAWWMISAARSSGQQLAIRDALVLGTARDAMQQPPATVPADLSLAEALDNYLRGREGESFPVIEQGKVVGMLSFRSARKVGAEDPMRPVRDGMTPLDDVLTVPVDERLDDVVDKLGPGRAALVLDGEALAGSIRPSDIEAWLRTRTQQAQPAPPRPDR